MTRKRLFTRSSLFATVLLAAAGCAPTRAPVSQPGPPPASEPEQLGNGPEIRAEPVRQTKRDLLGGVAYDLPVEANSWVEAELNFLVNERRAVVDRWLSRADFYEGYVKQILAAQGVPTDLHHLAMIESGYVPTARSRAGAVGIWQFMPATGRGLGLRIDSEVDERMDPVRSTRAATRHLRGLYRHFGDWALAAAAYNAGSGRISRGMQRFGVSNFWDLAAYGDLAEETKHYVPRLYAMTVIARSRTRFGFPPPAASASAVQFVGASPVPLATARGRGFAYDSIEVDFATPLAELSRIGGVGADQLAALNPHLFRQSTPAGRYWLWVPAGSGRALQEAYFTSDFRAQKGFSSYTLREGDDLATLVVVAGVPEERVREINPGVDLRKLKPGQSVTLPATAAQMLVARPAPREEKRVAEKKKESTTKKEATSEAESKKEDRKNKEAEKGESAETKPAGKANESGKDASQAPNAADKAADASRTHGVADGETLWSIARAYGVSVEELQVANELSNSVIVVGKELRIPSGKSPAAAPAKAAEHVVQPGETLWGIARHYDTSVASLEKANEIRDGMIQPGQKLRIPR